MEFIKNLMFKPMCSKLVFARVRSEPNTSPRTNRTDYEPQCLINLYTGLYRQTQVIRQNHLGATNTITVMFFF